MDPRVLRSLVDDRTTTTATAWSVFERALALVLAALAEDQYLIVTVKGARVDEDGASGSPYYVQFAAQGAHGLRTEAVSNNFLAGAERLDATKQRLLRGLGWSAPTSGATSDARRDPDGSPNHFRDWAAPVPFAEVARVAVATLREVFAVPHPGYLTYTAFADDAQILLPTLGLARELPEPPAIDDDDEAESVIVHPANPAELRDAAATTLRILLKTDDLVVDDDGDVPLSWGNATIYVRILEDVPVVRCISVAATDVTPSTALRDAVNELNRAHPLVRAHWTDDAVILTADVYASPFVPDHLVNVLHTLAEIADETSDELSARFGHEVEARGSSLGGYL
jgi:hypothetical protein